MGNIYRIGGTPDFRVRLSQAKTSALLSALFLLVYASCNWLASMRADVGQWFFAWERHIPFVPIMILPYMSLDLFFIAAPFLQSQEHDRRMFAKRIIAAIGVAGMFFLFLPLQFAFSRPDVSGWLGSVYRAFYSFDQPFNLFPSLLQMGGCYEVFFYG